MSSSEDESNLPGSLPPVSDDESDGSGPPGSDDERDERNSLSVEEKSRSEARESEEMATSRNEAGELGLVGVIAASLKAGGVVAWFDVVLPRITAESAAERDLEGRLPLHLAARSETPLEVVAALLKAHKTGAAEVDQYGNLPLHWAAIYEAPLVTVLALLEANKAAAAVKNTQGRLPLHLAVEKQAPPTAVLAVLEAHKAGAAERDDKGMLPLHYSLEYKAPLEVVQALLAAHKAGAAERDNQNKLPLYWALEYKAPPDVVLALLEAYPEAAREKNQGGRLPLHAATEGKAPPEVIAALLAAYPEAARDGEQATLRNEASKERLVDVIATAVTSKEDVQWVVVVLPRITTESAKERDDKGMVPLHYAAQKEAPLEVVLALLEAHKAGAAEKDVHGKLPLHEAAANKAPLDVVLALLAAHPEAVREKNNPGQLPLYLAINNCASPEVVDALRAAMSSLAEARLQAYLDAAATGEKDDEGQTALHQAVFEGAPVSILGAIITAHTEAAREKDKYGRLPLHHAAQFKAPLDVVLALLEAHKAGAAEKDSEEKLPLHLAAEHKAPLDVVLALLEAHKAGAAEKDEWRRLPLHFAAVKEVPLEVVLALLEAHKAGAAEKDGNEKLPLHHAAEREAPLEVVLALLEAHKAGAAEKDRYSKLPLHVAAEHKAPLEVVLALLEAYKAGAAEKDTYGMLPLHCAAVRKAPLEVVLALLEAHKAGAAEKNEEGRLPLYYAAERKAPVKVLIALLMADLPVHTDAAATPVEGHGHSWTAFVDGTKTDPAKSKAVVKAIFSHFNNSQAHCLALAHTKDELGREAILIAHTEVQQLMYSYIFFCGRYELQAGPPVHRSATAVVLYALDHGVTPAAKVAIKFMRNEEQWQREIDVRDKRGKQRLDGRFVVGLLPAPPLETFQQQVCGLTMHDGKSMASYQHGIIMPAADRSLDEISKKERPDVQHVKTMMAEVGAALQYCHAQGIVHGDLKMLNALRLDGLISLIDMDASCVFDPSSPENSDFAGSKFSSGILPPEMFCELRGDEIEAYTRYWSDIASLDLGRPDLTEKERADAELWLKVEPRRVRTGKVVTRVVVKTFKTQVKSDDEGGTYDEAVTEGLPYASQLVHASPDVDIWAFALMLFALLSGEPLLPVNRDDDLSRPEDVLQALSWTQEQLDARIAAIALPGNEADLAKDLLKKLLRPRPADRLRSMEAVMQHAFFSVGGTTEALQALLLSSQQQQASLSRLEDMSSRILDNTEQLKCVSNRTLGQIKRTEAILLRGMMEAGDVTVPSCFIVVPHLLSEELFVDRPEAALDWENIPHRALGDDSDDDSDDESDDGDCPLEDMAEELRDRAAQASRWMGALGGVGRQCSHALRSRGAAGLADKVAKASRVAGRLSARLSSAVEFALDPAAVVAKAFKGRMETTLYLYLVNEVTHKPVIPPAGVPSVYPLKITSPSQFAEKFMPLMKVGLKVMCVYNGVAGLAQCFGYPVPRIPAGVCRSLKRAVGSLDAASSVAEFDCLQGEVDSITSGKDAHRSDAERAEAAKAVRGKQLRDLQTFFALPENDPGGDFCGLRRVLTPDGSCVWTTDADVRAMEQEARDESAKKWTVAGSRSGSASGSGSRSGSLPPAGADEKDLVMAALRAQVAAFEEKERQRQQEKEDDNEEEDDGDEDDEEDGDEQKEEDGEEAGLRASRRGSRRGRPRRAKGKGRKSRTSKAAAGPTLPSLPLPPSAPAPAPAISAPAVPLAEAEVLRAKMLALQQEAADLRAQLADKLELNGILRDQQRHQQKHQEQLNDKLDALAAAQKAAAAAAQKAAAAGGGGCFGRGGGGTGAVEPSSPRRSSLGVSRDARASQERGSLHSGRVMESAMELNPMAPSKRLGAGR